MQDSLESDAIIPLVPGLEAWFKRNIDLLTDLINPNSDEYPHKLSSQLEKLPIDLLDELLKLLDVQTLSVITQSKQNSKIIKHAYTELFSRTAPDATRLQTHLLRQWSDFECPVDKTQLTAYLSTPAMPGQNLAYACICLIRI